MNILELMDSKASSFSKNERKIYESIKKFPDAFANESLSTISFKSGFTKPALTRFAQKLGFNGFTEFQYQFNLDQESLTRSDDKDSLAEIYAGVLLRTEEIMDDKELELIKQKIMDSRAIYIKGTNLSRLPAEELQIALSLKPPYLPILIPEDIPPTTFNQKDVLILFSAQTGSSHQDFCRILRNKELVHPYSILVTTNAKHPLRHNFTQVVVLPSVNLAIGKKAALSDTFSFLYFNECLMEKLEKS
ncbi:MAG: MurR/RpiR family transcriptional regulator [Faecalicoccus sp.]|nr:MurR/RpiR family transcriptional regulator [Faecalicoccus sp.]